MLSTTPLDGSPVTFAGASPDSPCPPFAAIPPPAAENATDTANAAAKTGTGSASVPADTPPSPPDDTQIWVKIPPVAGAARAGGEADSRLVRSVAFSAETGDEAGDDVAEAGNGDGLGQGAPS